MSEEITSVLNDLTKLILAIEDDCNQDPLWRRFYQIQMSSYFLSKKDFNFRMKEAEEAYDLIVQSWTDLKSYVEDPLFSINNLDNIFKTTIIDFPVDDFTITSFLNNDNLISESN